MSSVNIKKTKNNKNQENIYKITSIYNEEKTVKELIKELLATKSKHIS